MPDAPEAPPEHRRAALRAGARDGLPFAIASGVLALSFGVVARHAGLSAVAAIVMSLIVFAGSAQFAAVAIVGSGGGTGAAVLAAALMNSRFLPMGIALAPSLPGGPLRRFLQGQTVVDSSWAMALRTGGRFDRWYLFAHSGVQYVGWNTGTAAGVVLSGLIRHPEKLGLDAIFPAFFIGILFGELRDHRARGVAAAGAAVALALVPFTPPGVPVLAASVAALAGLHPAMERSDR